MSLAIRALLAKAARDAVLNGGPVSTDIQMQLAAEGYDLGRLERDVERINAQRAANI